MSYKYTDKRQVSMHATGGKSRDELLPSLRKLSRVIQTV